MRSEYTPEELLPLSGIQHFVFCRRQWALIQIERQWQDNALTADGKLLHQRTDDPFFTEKRKGIIIARSVPVASYRLGIIGICDVVEFVESNDGISLPGRTGFFTPAPVEYKRGKEKTSLCDEAQLCAQAICLEEMLSTVIPRGYLYYNQIRHRVEVNFTEELRSFIFKMTSEMHAYYERGYTPRVKISKACRSCSLVDICLPEVLEKPVFRYIKDHLENL